MITPILTSSLAVKSEGWKYLNVQFATWFSDLLKNYPENGGYNIMKISTIKQRVFSVAKASYQTLMQPYICISATTSCASNVDKSVTANAWRK